MRVTIDLDTAYPGIDELLPNSLEGVYVEMEPAPQTRPDPPTAAQCAQPH
ncbi:MAG: hypothetical protein MOB07_18480 [Acidobacteria bacterium]|nr:hypothetical protein [Acidobacteriota bacterium]